MKTFYVYGNSDQMYEMLINNSIYAKSGTAVDMQALTAGFLSRNFIFCSSKELSDEIKSSGCTESFRPSIAEIEFDEASSAPVLPVKKSDDGTIQLLTEWKKLSEVPKNDDLLGIFIPGEVPASYLQRLLFDSKEDQTNFPRSSSDLWVPADQMGLLDNSEARSSLTLEDIRKLSEEADAFISPEEAQRISHLVEVRNRRKAACYYTIEATKSWKKGPITANIDHYLLSVLNDGSQFLESCRKSFQKEAGDKQTAFDDYFLHKDPVLEDPETLEGKLFQTIMQVMEEQTPIGQNLDDDLFDEIGKRYIGSLSEEEAKEAAGPLHIVQMFLDESIMDPDEALNKLQNFSLFKAFMLYWFYRNNADYMRNSSVKLDQYGKRYEYIMLGTAGGMDQVDGAEKSKRKIEYALERHILHELPDEHLISTVNEEKNCTFIKNADETEDFIPTFKTASEEKDILKKLESCDDHAVLERVYLKIEDVIPKNKDFYLLVDPVDISVVVKGNVIGKCTIKKKSEAKNGGPKFSKLIKSMPETFDGEAFRKYASDKTRFTEIYKKHEDDLKNLLGEHK